MGSVLLLLLFLGFIMSDKSEKIEFLKEFIINIGGTLILAAVIIFFLDKFDILPYKSTIYFLRRILFGNPF
jgi:hypothetical protein